MRNGHISKGRSLALAALIAFLTSPVPHSLAENGQTPTDAQIQTARSASKELGENLKAQLVAALKSGGPKVAVSVCRTIAPAIAESASETHKLTIRRTSLKVRNPANAPDAFEKNVLEDFVRQMEAGAEPAKLEHAEIVTENGQSTFRYMKAIPTAAEPCLACHGSAIKPELKAEILRLYPADEATGFKAGELRGAFSVSQPMP